MTIACITSIYWVTQSNNQVTTKINAGVTSVINSFWLIFHRILSETIQWHQPSIWVISKAASASFPTYCCIAACQLLLWWEDDAYRWTFSINASMESRASPTMDAPTIEKLKSWSRRVESGDAWDYKILLAIRFEQLCPMEIFWLINFLKIFR